MLDKTRQQNRDAQSRLDTFWEPKPLKSQYLLYWRDDVLFEICSWSILVHPNTRRIKLLLLPNYPGISQVFGIPFEIGNHPNFESSGVGWLIWQLSIPSSPCVIRPNKGLIRRERVILQSFLQSIPMSRLKVTLFWSSVITCQNMSNGYQAFQTSRATHQDQPTPLILLGGASHMANNPSTYI